MKIYRTTKKVDEFDIDEKDFLNYIKQENLEDEDIQKINNIDKLIKEFGHIDEFSLELDMYLFNKTNRCFNSSISYYDNYNEAYDDMEWGTPH